VPVDIQVAFPQEAVSLTSVRILPGVLPKTLDIIGQDFSSVDEVLINEMASTDVVVLSKNRLLAQLPELAASGGVHSVSVTSRRLTITSRSFIRFRLSKTPGKVRGILRLMQLFLKLLFTTAGTDIFSPKMGGSALKNLGKTFGKDQGGAIVSDFVVAVDNTSRHIVALQGRDPSIPADERLLNAQVLSANFDFQQSALIVSVELTSQAGRAAVANVMT
jgi:IPT/TIG domain-containing protein